MNRKFQRKTEDFSCMHCDRTVNGNGYTNHCPSCLWCRHVDVFPGDRQNPCRGMMEPIAIDTKAGVTAIIHRCVRCGHTGRNIASPDDSSVTLLRLASETIPPKRDRDDV